MAKLKLKIEDLEERIAPSYVFLEGSQPDVAGAEPVGGQGDFTASFGPSIADAPDGSDFAAWTPHLSGHTPLGNGGDA